MVNMRNDGDVANSLDIGHWVQLGVMLKWRAL
jgi:hypothetical protein